MSKKLFFAALVFVAAAFPQDTFSVIVNKDNPATSISKNQLRQMIVGEGSWSGGAKLVVLLAAPGSSARTAVLKEVCGMNEGDFAKHLLKVKFEGGNKTVPKTVPSAAAVVQMVQATPGGLGIVETAGIPDGVKVLPIE